MSAFEHAARLLEGAHKPLLLVGSGARGAMEQIELLRVRLAAPILTTPEAKSQVDETRSEAGGAFSFAASARADELVEAADLVVAIGTELGEFASRGGKAFCGKALLQIVDDPYDVATAVVPDVIIVRALADACVALSALIPSRADVRPWFLESRKIAAVKALRQPPTPGDALDPAAAMAVVGASLPRRARLACDVTSATLVLLRDLALSPEQRLWCNLERSACMGGAIAAGLGLRLASGLPTLVIIGDWGLMMGSSELHTLAALSLANFVVVVWSNRGGALIRAGVKAQGLSVTRELHTWNSPPDFVQVARGYGLSGTRAHSVSGLRRALRRALSATRPTLIEAMIAPDADVPAGDRYLHLDASTGSVPLATDGRA